MYFSLFSSTSQFGHDGGYQSVGDVFKNGGTYAIVGYLTVFAVLAIIWGVLELFHLASNGKKKKAAGTETPAPAVSAPQPTEETAVAPSVPATNDDEIVAVIAAAIAAAQSENPIGSFRVVSFKRK